MALGIWVANTTLSPHPQWLKPVASTYVRGSPPVFDSASPRLPFLPGRSDWCFCGGSWWLQPPVSAAGWAEEALVKEDYFSFSVLPRCSFLRCLGQKQSGTVGQRGRRDCPVGLRIPCPAWQPRILSPAASGCHGPSHSAKSGISSGLHEPA